MFHVKQGGGVMTPDEFAAATCVSCETLDRLKAYAELLEKWQAKINLVGPDTVPDLWRRHFLDSAQLYPHIPQSTHRVMDMGSGAGFPGLVLAIMGAPDVHLVDSDGRKCVFLREVARITETKVTVVNLRLEALAGLSADLVTARAAAPLHKLLSWSAPLVAPKAQYLLLKGRGVEDELTEAGKDWNITYERIPSQSDPSGTILHLKEVSRGRAER
jgi:16S rRNA (guanine527-N7)-methyltransferase